jgi:aspartate 1-decarboxylase
MNRIILKSKIHRATVTDANLNYEGSITIDADLMEAADLRQWEEVKIWNVTNGERFETYAMVGKRGSGVICLNGAAARKVSIEDKIIIASYAIMTEDELENFEPLIVLVDDKNRRKVERKLRAVQSKSGSGTGNSNDNWLLDP